jgi:hypothetical protein
VCWNEHSTVRVNDTDDTWKKGYAVKFLRKDTGLLADKWCHSKTDCYKLHTILRSSEVATKLSTGHGSHFADFGFNIFTDISGAIGYHGYWHTPLWKEPEDGENVIIECWYRYVTKSCKTTHGPCVAAKEMIICYVHPNQVSV